MIFLFYFEFVILCEFFLILYKMTHKKLLSGGQVMSPNIERKNLYAYIPVGDITADLQPFLKPGSTARMVCPFNGGVNNKLFKLVANTSIEDFSALLVNWDLVKMKNVIRYPQHSKGH